MQDSLTVRERFLYKKLSEKTLYLIISVMHPLLSIPLHTQPFFFVNPDLIQNYTKPPRQKPALSLTAETQESNTNEGA